MRVLKYFLFLGLLTGVLSSCNGGDVNEPTVNADDEKIITPESFVMIDLTDYGYEFEIAVPDTNNKPLAFAENNNGTMEVKLGLIYDVTVGYDGDLGYKKEELKISNDVYKVEILEEKDNYIVYKSILNGNGKEFYHFYAVKKINGEVFEFKDTQGEYQREESQIRKMLGFVLMSGNDEHQEGA